jgi:hypothetical protein
MILTHYFLKELGTPFSRQDLIRHFFSFGGVCWTKSELILRKIRKRIFNPDPAFPPQSAFSGQQAKPAYAGTAREK